MTPIIFFPCLLILKTLTTDGYCAVHYDDLLFYKQLGDSSYTGKYAVNKCDIKQRNLLTTVQGNIELHRKIEVKCDGK